MRWPLLTRSWLRFRKWLGNGYVFGLSDTFTTSGVCTTAELSCFRWYFLTEDYSVKIPDLLLVLE